MPPRKKSAARKATSTKDKSLESWIWDAACPIRGAKDAPAYSRAERDRLPKAARRADAGASGNDYILSLNFTKRFCGVSDDAAPRRSASRESSADCRSLRSRPAGWLRCAPHCSTANAAGQWDWVQHMHASLKAEGRATVVLDAGAASRGSENAGTNKEKAVRQWFVDQDLIECVLYLPEPSGASQTALEDSPEGERGGANQNLFYNTTTPGIVLFLNKAKSRRRGTRAGKVLMVNPSQVFEKGDSKNFIPQAGIDRLREELPSILSSVPEKCCSASLLL